jgi:hypothetical protein
VSDIAKGILSGGWALVAGWILPTAINVLIIGFFVLPSLRWLSLVNELERASTADRSLAALGASVVIGLTLSALQSPLYRVLEGYLLWPPWVARKNRARWVGAKHLLSNRLDLIRLCTLRTQGRLTELEDKTRLAELKADAKVMRFARRDLARTTVQRALLRERLRRFPVDDAQLAPTRLGNAIRRLEEYGYQRYRLDSQALWYELTAAAPKRLSQQVDAARAGVDFFVCLLYGNLLVAVVALASLSAHLARRPTLLVTAAVLIVASMLWYRLAVATTDDWALAVRALVNVGRKPLAKALGLHLPNELGQEREMWSTYSRFVRQPYNTNLAAKIHGSPIIAQGRRSGETSSPHETR